MWVLGQTAEAAPASASLRGPRRDSRNWPRTAWGGGEGGGLGAGRQRASPPEAHSWAPSSSGRGPVSSGAA